MNRIDRLSAILTHLQSSRLITGSDIARRFDISLRTVYRDIRALEQAGVPVIGEAGLGYSIMEGYRLPPVMFTREEALAFLMAEKIVRKVTDQHNSVYIPAGMDITGFRVFLYRGDLNPNITPTEANSSHWHVNWCGIGTK